MKSFFKIFFAALLAVLAGSIIYSIIGFVVFAGIIGGVSSSPTYILKDKTVLKIDLSGSLNERKVDSPLSSLTGESSIGIDDLLSAIKKAGENEFVKGIYIKSGSLSTGFASLEPVRKALLDFKTSGKFIVSYGDSYGQGAYYLASVADNIILNPKGSLDFSGISGRFMSVRGAYEKMGVKYQVYKVGTFKSAVEPYIQDKMSDANREQMSSFVGDIWSHILTNISESRNLSVETLNAYADKCLSFIEADSLVELGMIDKLLYTPDVEKYLKELTETGEKEDLNMASVSDMKSVIDKDRKKSKDKIAVLYAEGSIVGDDAGDSFLSGSVITAKEYVKELEKLKNDEDVKAVVFRVNSGGGSAYASEQIWNAVSELKKVKPIVVSMGDYAASGGYYISCAATSIVAEPTTLTGSIGIFALIPQGEELAKKMGVSFDEVKTNKHSTFGGASFGIPLLISAMSRPMTSDESAMLQKYIETGYDLFISRCADGRSMTKEEIDAIGQGRVWTGAQALNIGLVDRLGSLDDAVVLAAEAAGIEDYKLRSYPVQEDFITKLLKGSFKETKLKMLKFAVNEDDYKEQILIKAMNATEICVAEMPERVSF
ncbi:MAG: signal peptide peptidase SppA [Tannerella sp.]|jgi:protease-4|nr:signal peptide peptidase SppA [Tannerella sp.]